MEKYSTIFMKPFIFIDSYAFLASSLDTLSSNLDDEIKRSYLSQIFPEHKIGNLLKKGALPYEYMDDWKRFEETSLPSIEKFYSTLTDSTIDQELYDRLQTIWNQFECRNLGEFQDIYLKVDVLLLAAVFETFRKSCIKEFELDPAHFCSIPGLSWEAALRKTNVVLDLLSDIDMIIMIEKGIRGGISCAMTHHIKANNPEVPSYNPNESNSFITYLDVNNLYGWALAQKLPTHNFEWVDMWQFGDVIEIFLSGSEEKVYILKVDLIYPEHLHDEHDDYPLAPEKMAIQEGQLSPYQRNQLRILRERGQKRVKSEKLITSLMDKHKYVIYTRI